VDEDMKTTSPRKQRKQLYTAPLHKRYKIFSAPVSPDLKKSHGINALPVRSGDTVKIMRGERKGFEGKVTEIDRTKYRISIEGVTREKVDGTAVPMPIHPSKVMITNLNLDDKWRKEILKRKGKGEKAKPPAEEKIVKEEEKRRPRKKKAKKEKKASEETAKKSGEE
jgi:large subunit ribosomal protein L24